MGIHYFFLYSLIGLLCFQLSSQNIEALTKWYETKTLDEIRIHVRILEGMATETINNEDIHGYNRQELINYIQTLIESYSEIDRYEDIEAYKTDIVNNLDPQNIKAKYSGEHGFIVKWAINAERYKRKMTHTAYKSGGLVDYANYMFTNDLQNLLIKIEEEYSELKNKDVLAKEIFNIYNYQLKTSNYITSQQFTKEELYAMIVQVEFYLGLHGKEDPDLKNLDHDSLIQQEESALLPLLNSVISKHEELKNTDDFINIIIYRDVSYTSPKVLFDSIKDDEKLIQWALACEKYYKKNNNKYKSLRNLKDYLKAIPIEKTKNYILKQLIKFPELFQENRFEDIIENDKNLQYGQVKEFLQSNTREILIKYYLNFQVDPSITSIYNQTLSTIYRMKDEDITKKIIQFTNDNITLQNKEVLINLGKLNHDNVEYFMNYQPKTVLEKIANTLFDYHKSQSNNQALTKNTDDLKTFSINVCNSNSLSTLSTLREKVKGIEEVSPLYGNILDVLRSVNERTLKLWLRNFEGYARKVKKYKNILGGTYTSFNNYTTFQKDKIINKIMEYIDMFPELSTFKTFTEITRMSDHYSILSTFHDSTLYDYAANLDGYRRRKNPQLTYNDHYKKKYTISNTTNHKFFIMKIMAMFPELNIREVFEKVTYQINPLHNFTDFLVTQGVEDLRKFAKELQKYHNAIKEEQESINLDTYLKADLQVYIESKRKESPQLSDDNNFLRALYGESEMLYYDNYTTFLNRQDNDTIKKIYTNLVKYIEKKYNIDLTRLSEEEEKDIEQMKKYIRENVNNFTDLQNPETFDREIDKIEGCENLKELSRGNLLRIALGCQLYASSNNIQTIPSIDSIVHVMTNNEFIRYINKALTTFNISLDKMFLYSEKNYLSYGEDLVSYLTEY